MKSKIHLGLFIFLILLVNACSSTSKYVLYDEEISHSPNVILYAPSKEIHDPINPEITLIPKKTDLLFLSSGGQNIHKSLNGGNTWTSERLSSDTEYIDKTTIISDNHGTLHSFLIAGNKIENYTYSCTGNQLLYFQSRSAGLEWTGERTIYTAEYSIYNPIAISMGKKIYIFWSEVAENQQGDAQCKTLLRFMKSENQGQTWSDPKTITSLYKICKDCIEKSLKISVTSGSDNILFITYFNDGNIYMNKSMDEGESWSEDIEVVSAWDNPLDSLETVFVSSPTLTFDESHGKNRGKLYLIFNKKNEDGIQVLVMMSKDMGATWHEPRAVNLRNKEDQEFPSAIIDQSDGQLYVLYLNKMENDSLYQAHLAYSEDGGSTFRTMVVSDQLTQMYNSAEHHQLTVISASKGVVRPVWVHTEEGKTSLRTALINRKATH